MRRKDIAQENLVSFSKVATSVLPDRRQSEADHPQLSLAFDSTPSHVATTRAKNKKAGKRIAVVVQHQLRVIGLNGFEPRTGVPKTRADCPDTSNAFCPWIRCRYHLFLEDAEHRAGRPGLSSVPRNDRGLTVSVEGDLPGEGPGTTFAARWLELERSAKVEMRYDEHGSVAEALPYYPISTNDLARWVLKNRRVGTLDTMLPYLRVGEPIDVYNDIDERVCGARLTDAGTLAFDRKPTEAVLTLVRVRGVESCALDSIARKGKHSNQEAGECLARHRTLIAREGRGAARKATETAEEMGMSRMDFMEALTRMGDK